jgi:hypothetical protein
MKRGTVVGLAIDLVVGLLLAGLVAPLALAVLPSPLHGRAMILGVCVLCVVAAHALREMASG